MQQQQQQQQQQSSARSTRDRDGLSRRVSGLVQTRRPWRWRWWTLAGWFAFWVVIPVAIALCLIAPAIMSVTTPASASPGRLAVFAYADDFDETPVTSQIHYGADLERGVETIEVDFHRAGDSVPVYSFELYASGLGAEPWECGPSRGSDDLADEANGAASRAKLRRMDEWGPILSPGQGFDAVPGGGLWDLELEVPESETQDASAIFCVHSLSQRTWFTAHPQIAPPIIYARADVETTSTSSTRVSFPQQWAISELQAGGKPAVTLDRGLITRLTTAHRAELAVSDPITILFTDPSAEDHIAAAISAAIFLGGAWLGVFGGISAHVFSRRLAWDEVRADVGRRGGRRSVSRRSPIRGASRRR